MTNDLLKAILAMDSYNRSYNEGIELEGTSLGAINILQKYDGQNWVNFDSSTLTDSEGERRDADISFYAIAYERTYQDENNQTVSEIIISYRGTDDPWADLGTGYSASGANTSLPQTKMAFEFYNAVAADNPGKTITLTGHSMGGGLAGMVAAVKGANASIFDSMAYQDAAQKLRTDWLDYATNPSDYAHRISNDAPLTPIDTLTTVFGNLPDPFVAPPVVDFSNISSIELQAQFAAVDFAMDDADIPLSIGDNVEIGWGPDWVDLHSISTLAIRTYAGVTAQEQETFGVAWKKAAAYFWPILYDNDFAEDIGVDVAINGTDDAHQKLRSAIAYSALDSGERPYGDTAIDALFNDANDFGAALDALPALSYFATDTLLGFGGIEPAELVKACWRA